MILFVFNGLSTVLFLFQDFMNRENNSQHPDKQQNCRDNQKYLGVFIHFPGWLWMYIVTKLNGMGVYNVINE